MSTTQYATTFRINPATAAKAFTELVDEGVLYKRRGIGMFVADGARERLLAQRRATFFADVVEPVLEQARVLGISVDEIVDRLRREGGTAMSGFGVEVRDLTARYGTTVALDAVSFTIRPGVITGLLGRNGSGKTTALSVLAAFRRETSGTVLVDGEDPWENARVLAGTCLVRESGDVPVDQKLEATLDFLGDRRPLFSRELADSLMDRFELDPLTKPEQAVARQAVGVRRRRRPREPRAADPARRGAPRHGRPLAVRVLRRPARRLAGAPAHDRPVQPPDRRGRAAARGRRRARPRHAC